MFRPCVTWPATLTDCGSCKWRRQRLKVVINQYGSSRPVTIAQIENAIVIRSRYAALRCRANLTRALDAGQPISSEQKVGVRQPDQEVGRQNWPPSAVKPVAAKRRFAFWSIGQSARTWRENSDGRLPSHRAPHPGLETAPGYKGQASREQDLKSSVHRELISKLDLEKLMRTQDGLARQQLLAVIHQLLGQPGIPFSAIERDGLAREVLDEVFGLGPLEPLLQDPTVSDILVNTYKTVYVERRGVLEETSSSSKTMSTSCTSWRRSSPAVGETGG